MKCLIPFFFLFIVTTTSAQNISGLYSGTLINDSLKMVQNYELALSEYKGKITGYSYITFVSNDTFYYGIKRIKASRKNGELVVEDVEMLANNYPKRPDKGVHVINRIPLPPGQDTILNMNGRWETTGTKKFYSINGALNLRKDDDSTHSPLVAHLKELKEINYQEEKIERKDIAKTEVKQKPKEAKTESKEIALKENKPVEASSTQEEIKETASAEIIAKRKPSTKPLTENKPKDVITQNEIVTPVTTAETKTNEIIVQENKPKQAIAQTGRAEIKTKIITAPEQQKPAGTSATAEKPKEIKEIVSTSVQTKKPEITVVSTTSEVKPTASSELTKITGDLSPIVKRITNTIQTVNVISDSLVLTFYDNGVVDGDSISVYLDDQNIISKVKLTEAAVKKTIFTNAASADGIRLTLVAENLGSIPPNTGLLIIQDGTERYQIRFSADMQTNASVIIKKKK